MSPSPDLKRRRSDDGSGASRSFPERAVTRVTPADTPASTFPNVPTVGPSGLIHKRQYVRLLEQSLYELGFADLASALEKRSVVISLENLMTFPFVEERVKSGALSLHGLWTGIGEGALEEYNPASDQFRPVG